MKKILKFSWIIITLFISCQTAPQTPGEFMEEASYIPLDNGASAYIFADVKQARPILDLLPINELNDRQALRMIDRTDFLAAAIFPAEDGRRFQLAAWGNYPSFGAGLALGFNRYWKRQRSAAGNYWYSQANRLSMTLTPTQAFVAASATAVPESPVPSAPGIEPPEGFGEFRRESPLSCWLEDPAQLLNRILNMNGIPIRVPAQQLFVNFFIAPENQYEAVIRLQFESPAQARAIAAALSLARNFVPEPPPRLGHSGEETQVDPASLFLMLFFANPPVQNNRSLDIKTAPMTDGEMVMLFQKLLN